MGNFLCNDGYGLQHFFYILFFFWSSFFYILQLMINDLVIVFIGCEWRPKYLLYELGSLSPSLDYIYAFGFCSFFLCYDSAMLV